MKHKAQVSSTILIMGEIGALILIAYLMTNAALEHAKGEKEFKQIVALDLKMMTDTLVGVPGNAEVRYPLNVSTLTIVATNFHITVKSASQSASVPIVLPEGYSISGFVQQKETVCMSKENKFILVRSCE